jgi:hypothetical protein
MARRANFDQGYEITQDGDKRIVTFSGDGVSWAAYIVFPIVFLGLSTLFFTAFWIVPLVVIGGALFLVYLMFNRQSFTLTPTGIIKGGKEYDLDRISEILIDNPMDGDISIVGQPTLLVGGAGVAGASMAAMGMMANATTSAMAGASIAVPSRMITLTLAVGPFLRQDGF